MRWYPSEVHVSVFVRAIQKDFEGGSLTKSLIDGEFWVELYVKTGGGNRGHTYTVQQHASELKKTTWPGSLAVILLLLQCCNSMCKVIMAHCGIAEY